jgi:NTP pyrophosphatase (non-canonical NTP hydrolase)
MSTDDLLIKAIETWGIGAQVDIAQEECAELIAAIAHYRRERPDAMKEMIEEIADVKIMMRQLELMFDIDKDVRAVMDYKLERLAGRLERTPKK